RNARHSMARIFELCGRPSMHVLGSLNPNAKAISFNPSHIIAYMRSSSRYPLIYCPKDTGISVQVIMFDRPQPHRMQYLSLSPIPLALDDKDERPSPTSDIIEAEEERERIRIAKLVGRLKQHTITP